MSWAAWLVSVAGPFVIQALIALGVGIVTVSGLDLALNTAMSWCTNALGGLSSAIVNVLAIAGFWQGFSYIAGAFATRLAMVGGGTFKKWFLQ
ncbi:DUF2523 family protein [Paraburkholderia sp. GAS82]|uniref:DUF2523 family protein n=1 Tax=Paraburkholderia sp. GAS82 TaxID=3035137 RepID=UPI003D254663